MPQQSSIPTRSPTLAQDKTNKSDALIGESRWWREIPKRNSRTIRVGNVMVGGNHPIVVQTMTNTLSSDVKGTLKQIISAHERGAELVRVSCPDPESTAALKTIVKESPVPIIADIHFHYLRAVEAAAAGVACLRVNPGNLGGKERLLEVVRAARDNDCAIRIGVNGGSLERDLLERYGSPCPEALVESAQRHCASLLEVGFTRFKVSLKASDALLAIASYRLMAKSCDHPLHIGITEAGALIPGTVKSAFGLGMLLAEGIGDTLRVSLAAPIEDEVRVGFELLKSLGLRHHGVSVIACPSCARQQFDVIRSVQQIEERLQHIRIPLSVSVIGCVVNGPGEAKLADIGLAGGGKNTHQVYIHGVPHHRIKDQDVIEHVVELVEQHAATMEARLNKSQPTQSRLPN